MPEQLTPKQSNILKLIKDFMAEHGYAPTVRELGRLARLKSTDTVQFHLDNLRSKGFLDSVTGKSRTLAFPGVERVAMMLSPKRRRSSRASAGRSAGCVAISAFTRSPKLGGSQRATSRTSRRVSGGAPVATAMASAPKA